MDAADTGARAGFKDVVFPLNNVLYLPGSSDGWCRSRRNLSCCCCCCLLKPPLTPSFRLMCSLSVRMNLTPLFFLLRCNAWRDRTQDLTHQADSDMALQQLLGANDLVNSALEKWQELASGDYFKHVNGGGGSAANPFAASSSSAGGVYLVSGWTPLMCRIIQSLSFIVVRRLPF